MAGTGASGRRSIPDEMKKLKGTLQKCRINRDAPTPDAAPDAYMVPPAFLDTAGKKEYKAKAELLRRLGVFKEGDNIALAAYAAAYSNWKTAMENIKVNGIVTTDPNGKPIKNPAVSVANDSMEKMRQFICEFGLTPASRQRIKVDKKEEKSEWDMFGDKRQQPPVAASVSTQELQ